MGRCIVYTGIRLLLHIYSFISSFFSLQFSNIKRFRHTFLRNYEALKVETWYTCGQWADVSCIPESGCCCLFVPLFLNFSYQFSNITSFRHTFLRNCEALKVETWYTRGHWADVSCILESGCCFLFVPLFLHFSFSQFFVTLFSGTVTLRRLKLGTHVPPESGYCCIFVSLFLHFPFSQFSFFSVSPIFSS